MCQMYVIVGTISYDVFAEDDHTSIADNFVFSATLILLLKINMHTLNCRYLPWSWTSSKWTQRLKKC